MNFENKQQSLLTFRVGSILCCAPSLYVQSIITPPKLTKPPGSSKAYPGIFKHGKHIVKVIDLRQKFGAPEESGVGNMIIINFDNQNFAFWVDQIIDVFDFPSIGWSGLPSGIPKDVFTRTLILNENIHLYTEFEKLITVGELSYFKNNTQQEKGGNIKEVVVKEKNKETIVEGSNEKTTTIFNKVEKHTPNTLPEKKLEIHTVTTKIKKPTTKIEKFREQNIRKQSPLIDNKKTENIVKIKPEKNINHIVENTQAHTDETSSNILFITLTLFIFLSIATLYYLYPTDIDSSVKQEYKSMTFNITEETKIYDEPLDQPLEIIEPVALPVIVENMSKNEKIIVDKEKSDSHHAKIKKIENKVIISVYTPKTIKKKLKPLIVHVVIKGDTLWAITKKYINDPFRYSELAALNKIKNPHRIYPGDQVQIRFIQR